MLPALLALLLAGLVQARPTSAEAQATPIAVAVLPFTELRRPTADAWLPRFLRERVTAALRRAPQSAVPDPDAATQWARILGLDSAAAVTAAHLERMGVQAAIQATTQTVLGLVEVRLAVVTPAGPVPDGSAQTLRLRLAAEPPHHFLERLLGVVQDALPAAGRLVGTDPAPPTDWEAVQDLYTLLGTPVVAADPSGRPPLIAKLRAWEDHPTLGGRARAALARLHLEQALLHLPQGAGRAHLLAAGLTHATAALAADPRDTARQALKAALHHFLRQDFEARAEASVARIRNPLEALAFAVLALSAGLSTGEANEQLKRALAVHPYLRGAARPRGSAPYLGGVLEPALQRWDELRARNRVVRAADGTEALRRAIARFEAKDWDEARRLFRQAGEASQGGHTPWLYLARIDLEQGRVDQALAALRTLAAEYPLEPELLHHLGVAYARAGDPDAARKLFRRVLEERPQHGPTLYRLGIAEMDAGNWQDALRALRAFLQGEPEHARAWLRLGTVQMRLRNWDAAESALERALELEPGSEDAQRRLTQVRNRRAR